MSEKASILITVEDRATRDLQLEQAASALQRQSLECGILITRHSFRTFTAALSPDVEYGFIQELDLL